MHSYGALALISVLWAVVGYTLAFGEDVGGIIGDLSYLFLKGVGGESAPAATQLPHTVFMGYQCMEVGVSTLPPLPVDLSDRNRTSPFAFTGNKFEFRAVGSSQSVAPVNIALNAAVASALDDIATELEASVAGGTELKAALQALLPRLFKEHMLFTSAFVVSPGLILSPTDASVSFLRLSLPAVAQPQILPQRHSKTHSIDNRKKILLFIVTPVRLFIRII